MVAGSILQQRLLNFGGYKYNSTFLHLITANMRLLAILNLLNSTPASFHWAYLTKCVQNILGEDSSIGGCRSTGIGSFLFDIIIFPPHHEKSMNTIHFTDPKNNQQLIWNVSLQFQCLHPLVISVLINT